MITSELHLHTKYSDGKNTPEEMVQRALELGFDTLGFTDHSYTFFDESYCMKKELINEYRAEITGLKEKYEGKIRILCGIEQDYYSDAPTDGYDYVIGSVHYLKIGDKYTAVDHLPEQHEDIEGYFGGDADAYAEQYFATVADVFEKTRCDIIGHFDLLTKFAERDMLFDVQSVRYKNAWKAACDKLLPCGKPFEINTGAMSRGYRTSPFPADDIRSYIAANGGKFVLTGDVHSAKILGTECFKM